MHRFREDGTQGAADRSRQVADDGQGTSFLRSQIGFSWSSILLVLILLGAGYLRFTGLDWDEGQYIHPDEGHMRNTVSRISIPEDVSLYFDTHRSPLNVRNQGGQYSYGTLPLFLTRAAAEWLDRACGPSPPPLSRPAAWLLVGPSVAGCGPGTFTGIHNAVVGRALSALGDLGSLLLVYLIGRRLFGEAAGLLAAGLMGLTAFSIQQAHFFTVDSTACFFTTLVAYFSVRAAQSGHWLDFALAGLAVGLAAGCKVSAAFAALLVAFAAAQHAIRNTQHAIHNTQHGSRFAFHASRLWPLLLCLLFAGLLSLIAFRVAQPYAFEGPGFFGIRPSPEWFGRLSQIRAEQSGEVDLPSGRQWTNRLSLVFPWLNMVVWGMGLPLGLAAWIGWAVVGIELFRGRRRHLVLWGWATVVFLYHSTRWVKTMRYFLSLYPIFVIFAAYLLIRLLRRQRDRPLLPASCSLLGYSSLVIVVGGALFWSVSVHSIYLRPHTRVAASRWIYEHVPEGSTVANEHWDWGLPLRIGGHDPFGGMYRGIEIANYDEDTPEKRRRLYEWLDQADYIFLASNRLYASIPRLPARYPLTTEYYRALFAGELGFELAADFTSYPALGPFEFPDQENPFELVEADYVNQRKPITVHLPPAEEAFSVYDHPRVLIFRKTERYSRQRVERILGGVDVERALHGLTPRQATKAPDLLRFDPQIWADQQAGGTWSEMFNRRGVLNRHPGLAALAWWAVVTALGWLTFPILFAVVSPQASASSGLPRLRDGGFGVAKMMGLLLVAYLTWLAASLRVLPNTQVTILRMVALLALVGGGVGWLKWEELWDFVRRRWRTLLLIEGLFALLYFGWLGVRLVHPDLWHPHVGGEKPMDFAYLNAVMKSTWFPPYNPWFSGTSMNYYYFGFVIVGTLIKLVGTVPAIAYNLAVPLLYALSGLGAFSVAYNLFGPRPVEARPSEGGSGGDWRRGALLAGLMAVVFTIVLGNLGVLHLVRAKLIELGGEPFPSTIPGFPETVGAARGLFRVLFTDAKLPLGAGSSSWYWHPTRIIPQDTGNPIAEFPAFTFLYADLHPNMIALPITLLALALIVYWVRAPRPHWVSLVFGGLAIGALYPTHTWDYPTYLVLGVAGLAVGVWAWKRRTVGDRLKALVWRAGALAVLSVLLYLPYSRNYAAGYTAVERWKDGRTPVGIYLWIHGIMLFPVVTYLLGEVWRVRRRVSWSAWLGVGATSVALAAGLFLVGYEVAVVVIPVAAFAALLVFAPRLRRRERFLWLLVGPAMGIGLGVEIIVLKGDVGRQNTVFKFYQQAWLFLSVAAAVALARVYVRAHCLPAEVRDLWWGVMILLVLGGALFLPLGIRARAVDRIAPEVGLTLDGMAFMKRAVITDGPDDDMTQIPLSGDYHAIRWMQDNIQGSPVVLEGLGKWEYLWANRVSIHTGLPAVVGWRWHQVQQRLGVLPAETVEWRRSDVNECYSTTDVTRAGEILSRYGVRYVYVGGYERAYYSAAGLAKFDRMVEQGLLRLAYDAHDVKIYEFAAS